VPNTGLILGLLAVVAIAAAVGRRVGLADPIVFAISGVALTLVPGIPNIALPPSLVLVVFLPPLIFAAARDTSWVPPDAVERVRGVYADRIERLERHHAVLVASGPDHADDARVHAGTRRLLEELADVERAELQRLQNAAVVDDRLARRLQHGLDIPQPLRDSARGPART